MWLYFLHLASDHERGHQASGSMGGGEDRRQPVASERVAASEVREEQGHMLVLGSQTRTQRKENVLDFHEIKQTASMKEAEKLKPTGEAPVTTHADVGDGRSEDKTQDMPGAGLTLSPRLKCTGAITAHCRLKLLAASNPSLSAPQRQGFAKLPRLVSDSWTQATHHALASQSVDLQA
ncbi:hypothetical protein AAY473_034822 [Plecturocebus cupreus]